MAEELYEVLLVDGGTRWHAGFLVGEEEDLLLAKGGRVLVWPTRAGLEHHAERAGLVLLDDLFRNARFRSLAAVLAEG